MRSLPAAHPLAIALIALAPIALASCRSQPIDPTANVPVRPTESRDCGETPPDALAPASRSVPVDERAVNTATRIEISQLSRIERTANAPTLIDVRIDAFDDSGSPAMIAGEIRIVLRTSRAEPCYLAFDVPMATKREVERRVDATLNQFVLRLETEWKTEPARGEDIDLTATLTRLDGRVLESSARLAW